MNTVLLTSQVIISILLVALILMQNKDAGLTATMGAAESFQATRRGPERLIFRGTVVLSALFLINALLFVFV